MQAKEGLVDVTLWSLPGMLLWPLAGPAATASFLAILAGLLIHQAYASRRAA